MRRHDEVRQHGLVGRFLCNSHVFRCDPVGPQLDKEVKLRRSRRLGTMISKVDDFALRGAVDRAMRFIDEALQSLGMPMITARLPLLSVHALLHDGPLPVRGRDEAMQIEIEPVLHRCTVDLGNKAACTNEPPAVQTNAIAENIQFVGRPTRMLAAAAADENAELILQRSKAALQCTDDARCDSRRVPVHAHDGPEKLEPEGMRQAREKFIAAVMMHDSFGDEPPECRHPSCEPGRYASAMQGKVSNACTLGHLSVPFRLAAFI
jgi:hypothetical protein